MPKIKIGIIKEEKIPVDHRVAITPEDAEKFSRTHPEVEIICESSPHRIFSDEQYRKCNIEVVDRLPDCDIIIGVKEIPVDRIRTGTSYFFFSHTIKKQAYNQPLLARFMSQGATLIDYEVIKEGGQRLIAFGYYAGVVGAYNGLLGYLKKSGLEQLPRASSLYDRKALFSAIEKVELPPLKAVITGTGRVGQGAREVLEAAGFSETTIDSFLNNDAERPVFVQLDPSAYVSHPTRPFDFSHFIGHPREYTSNFQRFLPVTDLLIAGAYWDPDAPRLFEWEDLPRVGFPEVIADITCDIDGSVPTTIRASEIANPFYDIDPATRKEYPPFSGNGRLSVMAVDNLPSELPRDASAHFSQILTDNILPLYLNQPEHPVITGATIVKEGVLTPDFLYLSDYAKGNI